MAGTSGVVAVVDGGWGDSEGSWGGGDGGMTCNDGDDSTSDVSDFVMVLTVMALAMKRAQA
jgi:hypothetical protein